MKIWLIIILIPGLVLPALVLGESSVTLAWDRNPEPDVSGYIVYYGNESRDYNYRDHVGNVTNYTVILPNPGFRTNWYFAVTATNLAGLESDYSNEVTNMVTVVSPPGQLVLFTGLESAPSPDGPWMEVWTTRMPITPDSNIFYRARTEITNELPPMP